MFEGKRVIIRTYSAGVHYGTMLSQEGKEVVLTNARRIWSWTGALSLHEIAASGLDITRSRISESVEAIKLTESIEIIIISEKSNLP